MVSYESHRSIKVVWRLRHPITAEIFRIIGGIGEVAEKIHGISGGASGVW